MSRNSKDKIVKIIKDPVWGTFEYYPHEQEILRSSIVNRLHKIKQNSLAYYVYPGLHYSRLAHSFGTMYIANEIFNNSIRNSTEEICNDFRNLLQTDINDSTIDEDEKAFLQKCFRSINPWDAIAIGILRIAGLLHDLGHLPYSHAFEFALQKVNYTHSHEDIGIFLTKILNKEIGMRNDTFYSNLAKKLLGLYIELKTSKDKLGLRCLETIIDASIDADRIDYLARDGLFSGLKPSVDFKRIILTYKLEKCSDDTILFLPSKKARTDIEHFFIERFRNRRVIVCHHRVILMDGLFKRSVVKMLEKNDAIINFLKNIEEVANGISGSSGIEKFSKAIRELTYYADDSWFDNKLRECLLNEEYDDETNFYLIGLLDNYKEYISIFKNDYDFWSDEMWSPEESKKIKQCLTQLVIGNPTIENVIIKTLKLKKGSIIVEGIAQKLSSGIPDKITKINEYNYYVNTLKIKRIFDFLKESYHNIIPLYLYIDSTILEEREKVKKEFKSVLLSMSD